MNAPAVSLPACPRCSTPHLPGALFCDSCRLYLRDATQSVERVTYTRRFFGSGLLEGVLFALTLFLGWFIWLFFAAQKSQTPAKSLTNIYVINLQTGRAVGPGGVWLRDVVLKMIVANAVVFGNLVDTIWILIDPDRQALHDKIVKTVVVYAPHGLPEAMLYAPGAPALYQAPPVFPGSSPAPASTVGSVGEQLRELKRLHDESLVSDEEYERKRADLASKL